MKIQAAALLPSTRACLAIAFGAPMPADSVLEIDVFSAQDLADGGVRTADAANGALTIQARIGASRVGYALSTQEGVIQTHFKRLLEDAFLRLLMPEGTATPDADTLRRRLHLGTRSALGREGG
jgi:hypothetical protein